MPEKSGNLEEILNKVANEQGFLRKELQKRVKNTKIDKAHYKFIYAPLYRTIKEEEFVLLDILFEKVLYKSIVSVKHTVIFFTWK